MTHNQYIKLFQDIQTNHEYINTFGDGDIELYSKNESNSNKGQTLWVNVKPKTINEITQNKVYTLWVMDFVNTDLSNNAEVLSDTERTFDDIIAILRDDYYNDFFVIEQISNLEPYQADKATLISGWMCDITFKELFDNDVCQVPISSLPTITT